MISSKTPFDRTNDFVKAVAAAKADAERQGKSKRLKLMTKAELSEFAEEAASIGRAIHCTTQKLKLFAEGNSFISFIFWKKTFGLKLLIVMMAMVMVVIFSLVYIQTYVHPAMLHFYRLLSF